MRLMSESDRVLVAHVRELAQRGVGGVQTVKFLLAVIDSMERAGAETVKDVVVELPRERVL